MKQVRDSACVGETLLGSLQAFGNNGILSRPLYSLDKRSVALYLVRFPLPTVGLFYLQQGNQKAGVKEFMG